MSSWKRWWKLNRPKRKLTPARFKGLAVAGTGQYKRRKSHGPWSGDAEEDTRSRREAQAERYERLADEG